MRRMSYGPMSFFSFMLNLWVMCVEIFLFTLFFRIHWGATRKGPGTGRFLSPEPELSFLTCFFLPKTLTKMGGSEFLLGSRLLDTSPIPQNIGLEDYFILEGNFSGGSC